MSCVVTSIGFFCGSQVEAAHLEQGFAGSMLHPDAKGSCF